MQPSRILAAVLIVLSGTGPLSAQKLIYLEGKKLNLLKLLPPPPEPGSEGEKKDILEVLEVQENRTPAEVALGIADDVLDIYRFETELGSKFKAANLPVTGKVQLFDGRVVDEAVPSEGLSPRMPQRWARRALRALRVESRLMTVGFIFAARRDPELAR